jgi:tetratricopeptide (TPR) repeat protein
MPAMSATRWRSPAGAFVHPPAWSRLVSTTVAGYVIATDSLGYAHQHLGHHTQAIACYQHAINPYRDLGDRYQEATILTRLADTYHTSGDTDAARRTTWRPPAKGSLKRGLTEECGDLFGDGALLVGRYDAGGDPRPVG